MPDFTPEQLEQLRDVFREVVREELAAMREPSSDEDDPCYLTIAGTCKRLHISKTTLWELRRQGKLRGQQVGRRVLFREADVVALAEGTPP